ncbi:transcriptional repressor LexA [Alicyclobacillus fastidiosus]|uniref:LexA repressor n=1 Tax=Alicyclobacillus fastidiosus TaxID=392011 RepID=A0ABY6ZDA0_9BACL|nr:transcriptional repressor LexA [Alicyclobacillus fastidiosus]WAH40100.1 transcriptional repressor LexA [Alicyclobacillus fastidiosus]GMA61425.1 LexA repressor [Alicyclobacillus fastidiosus]
MSQLTARQEAILAFIRKNVHEKGYPPSVREIGEAVGLASSSTVHGHLERLQQKGLIRRDPTKPRALELLSGAVEADDTRTDTATPSVLPSAFMAPIVGRVTAGLPISAFEDVQGYLPLPNEFTREDEVFVLTVTGDSMIEAGILNGDMVIVRRQSNAVNGDIVVAMTMDDEATVKRFFRENGQVRLQPENSQMPPLIYHDVSILGKVIGVFRNLR